MSEFSIRPIPCLRDNYAYLICESKPSQTPARAWLVDPSTVEPPRAALLEGGYLLQGILATHHHPDHVGGILGLCQWVTSQGHPRPWVAGHALDRGRIPEQSEFIAAPQKEFIATDLRVANTPVFAAHIPGHTTGAIAWKIGEQVFTGDTLFSGGCGRLFEGDAQQMFDSFRTLLSLPDETQLWFGHEYTASNLRFALSAEPEHHAYQEALDSLKTPSCPTTVKREKSINIFARAPDPAAFGRLREQKDRA